MNDYPSPVLASSAQDTQINRGALERNAADLNLYLVDYRDFVLLKWARNQMEIHRLTVDSADLLKELEDK